MKSIRDLFRPFLKKKVGLALGSGGARGFAHIGVIKVLEENNIPIDCIAGTSIGAVAAAYYALNLNITGLEEMSLGFKKSKILSWIDLNNPAVSLVKGKKLRKFLLELFGNKTFKDTMIPLSIGATALEDGKRVVFREGRIVDAIIASSSIPGIFPVVRHNEKHLVDGGLADALPIELARQMGANIIIGVDIHSFGEYKRERYGMKEALERTYQLLLSKLSEYEEKGYGAEIVVIRPEIRHIGIFAFYDAKEKIKIGENAAKKALPEIMELVR